MNILFLSHRFFPDVGGIEVNSEILAGHFLKMGHEVRLATWTQTTEFDRFPFQIVRAPSLRRLLLLHRWADVVYENNVCLRLSWPALLLQKPSVIALRTWIERSDGTIGYQDRLKRLWLRRAKAVIAVSEAIRDRCWPAATVIGNPYRSELFRVRSDVVRNRDFAFLGRLVSDKGVAMTLHALAALRDRTGRDFTLSVIGDGVERENLILLASELRVDNLVSFSGVLRGEELVESLNRHRYLWVPSRWEEPFGNVALEGIACGCIPVVSNGGGLPDAVGSAGLTFRRGDLNDMITQSERLITDTALREHLSAVAPNHLKNHNPESVSQRYLEVIKTALAKKNI